MKPRKASTRRGSTSKKTNGAAVPVSSKLVEVDYARLRKVTSVIQLDSILLLEAHISSLVDPRIVAAQLAGASEYTLATHEAKWHAEGTRLDVTLGYRVRAYLTAESESKNLFVAETRYIVSYRVPDDFEIPDDEAMADLVCVNGQINVFPYLRQQIVDLSTKSGWPALILPVFRAPAKRPTDLVKQAQAWD